MHAFVALLRDSERAWIAVLFAGLWLVLASGSPIGLTPGVLLSQIEAAALGALLAVWVARATGLRRHGLAIALAALFTTPLLPYAYVEDELALPLLLLAGAFLAIGPTRLRQPVRDLALLLVLAGALLAAASGLLLLPVLLWLAWCGAERRGFERRTDPKPPFYAAAAVLLALFAARAYRIDFSAVDFADSPVEWLIHVHGFLLSLNKGLLLFAPLVLFGLWRTFRGAVSDRHAGQFALASTACLIVTYSGLDSWSDAGWGPRHLLPSLAPAILALALSQSERAKRGGYRRWILAAVVWGLAVNTLGTAVPQAALTVRYGEVPPFLAAEAVQFHPAWNHPRANAGLLGRWLVTNLAGGAAGIEASPAIVRPSPVLLRVFDRTDGRGLRPLALLLAIAGAFGWGLLVLVRHAAKT